MSDQSSYRYQTTDFYPAPVGWRVAFLNASGMTIEPLPGWLLREEIEVPPYGDPETPTGHREPVAGRIDEDHIAPAIDDPSFWCVLGLGEDDPSPTEQVKAWEQKQQEAAALARVKANR